MLIVCVVLFFTNMNHVLFLCSKSKSSNLHSNLFLDLIENVIVPQLNIRDIWVVSGLALYLRWIRMLEHSSILCRKKWVIFLELASTLEIIRTKLYFSLSSFYYIDTNMEGKSQSSLLVVLINSGYFQSVCPSSLPSRYTLDYFFAF